MIAGQIRCESDTILGRSVVQECKNKVTLRVEKENPEGLREASDILGNAIVAGADTLCLFSNSLIRSRQRGLSYASNSEEPYTAHRTLCGRFGLARRAEHGSI